MFPNPFKKIKEIVSQSDEPSDFELQMMSDRKLLNYSRRLRGETQQLCQKIVTEKRQKRQKMREIEEFIDRASQVENQYSESSQVPDNYSDVDSNTQQVVNPDFQDFLNKLQG